LEFLASIGADEFAVRFLYAGEYGRAACDRLHQKIEFASAGKLSRECTVTSTNDSNPRNVKVWRFSPVVRHVLREVMLDGILGSSASRDAWAEDLCVYRRGELLFGTITHERYVFLRLSNAEWKTWEAQAATAREIM
jgi:hypothetical protein